MKKSLNLNNFCYFLVSVVFWLLNDAVMKYLESVISFWNIFAYFSVRGPKAFNYANE